MWWQRSAVLAGSAATGALVGLMLILTATGGGDPDPDRPGSMPQGVSGQAVIRGTGVPESSVAPSVGGSETAKTTASTTTPTTTPADGVADDDGEPITTTQAPPAAPDPETSASCPGKSPDHPRRAGCD